MTTFNKTLKINNVSKKFGSNPVLDGVSLTVHTGEIVAILGESGVGKTTLFNIIAGLLNPDDGDILLMEKSIKNDAGHLAYMLQKDLLLPHKTIIDNACLSLVLGGMTKHEARSKVQPYFETFGIEGTEHAYPHELSGGMRQRVAFLRTFMQSHEWVLLDEPFSALDTITKHRMQQWYLEMMTTLKTSTLIITHDVDEAILLADRIYILSGKPGTIVAEVTVDLPRPRAHDVNVSNSFMEVKKEVLSHLKQ